VSWTKLDQVRITCGKLQGNTWVFPIGTATLGMPAADSPGAALFDFGPGSEQVLVYQKKGGHQ
jgi:hypothetical protein